MRTISHRELRNNSAKVLAEVRSGEIIEVTNHGEPTAVLVPPSLSSYERLVAAGKIREPSSGVEVDLRGLRRGRAKHTTAEMIDDLRGER